MTHRNYEPSRAAAARQLSAWAGGKSGTSHLTGLALHTYADTWAHEGFTGVVTGSALNNTLTVGHLRAGHTPDHPYSDVPKAVEAAHAIFDIIPAIDNCATKFSDLESELMSQFSNSGSEEERVEAFKTLIQ